MKPLGTTVPHDEYLPTCAPSGLEPPTYHNLGATVISAPRFNQLGHQGP